MRARYASICSNQIALNEFDHRTKIWIKNILMSIENRFGSSPKTILPRPQAKLEALATSPLSFLHHPTTAMADHAPLVNFLSRLNTGTASEVRAPLKARRAMVMAMGFCPAIWLPRCTGARRFNIELTSWDVGLGLLRATSQI